MKWNEKRDVTRAVWDPSGTGGEKYVSQHLSLKEMLYSPGQVRFEDHLGNIGIGIAMIMDHLEQKTVKIDDQKTIDYIRGEFPVEPKKEITDAEFRAAHNGHSWVYTNDECPVCQGSLRENARGISCSQRGCGYVKNGN